MPQLSVIMATYKEDLAFLRKCISSVLSQTFQDFEFVITIEPDEPNINLLEDIAKTDSRVKVLKNKSRLGVAGSRNRAIIESSGNYIAFIDGDDYCALPRFEKQIAFLRANPEINVVGSNMYLIDENNNILGERKYPQTHKLIQNKFLFSMAIANPTIIARRKDFEDAGVFNGQLSKSEDFELWLRFLANNKKMYNLQESLVYYRVISSHNEKRGKVHWLNNYRARKQHGKNIWPLYKRLPSLYFYFLISHIPERFLNRLLSLKIINQLKNIESE